MARGRDVQERDAFKTLVAMGCPEWILKETCNALFKAAEPIAMRKRRSTRTKQLDGIKREVRAVDTALDRAGERLQVLIKQPAIFTMLPELYSLLGAIVAWKVGIKRLS